MHQLTFENEFVDTTSEYILNLSSIMMPKPHYSSHEEDWMERYMNINKLMQMIINKMKGYLKDDQLGFKYQ